MVKQASIVALFALAMASNGCFWRRANTVNKQEVVVTPSAETVITETPPPLPHEEISASPGPGYYWIPGYWSWQGRWIWVRGAWTIPPSPHAVYVPGRWAHRGHGYVWVSGHWR